MNDHAFDRLARGLAASTSRRDALKLLAGTAAAGLLSTVGLRGRGFGAASAVGRCRRVGANCRETSECCQGEVCDPAQGRCVCPTSNVCSKTKLCLGVCPEGQVFNPNTCMCECPSGTTACGTFLCCQSGTTCSSCGSGSKLCCPSGTPGCCSTVLPEGDVCLAPGETCCCRGALCGVCPPGSTCCTGFEVEFPECCTSGQTCVGGICQ